LTEAALEKARVGNKYSVLLQKISVPQDRNSYGDFRESDFWSGTEYADFTDLPKGYWVYVYPDWYIWQNKTGD
jgi:hypothetical protein